VTSTGAPEARFLHTAVWTGSEMVVWGGLGSTETLDNGGRYDPEGDAWSGVTDVDAPTARRNPTGFWTGSRMVVWGGQQGNYAETFEFHDDGGLYDPVTDSWEAAPLDSNPGPRALHSAVWTGDRMIVWGGKNNGGTIDNGGALVIDTGPDGDRDGDTICDPVDNCPDDPNTDQADVDTDAIGDVCDNCPDDFNPDQWDSDSNGIGDACDPCTDVDADTVCDHLDNCPRGYNPDQLEAVTLITGPHLDGRQVTDFKVTDDPVDPIVVYIADRDTPGVHELYSRPLFGRGHVKLSGPMTLEGDVLDFQITPDRQMVVYLADQEIDGSEKLYSVPIRGGQVHRMYQYYDFDVTRFEVTADNDTVIFQDQAALYSAWLDGTDSWFLVEGYWLNPDSYLGSWSITPDRRTVVYNQMFDQGDWATLETRSVASGGHSGQLFSPGIIGQGSIGFRISPTGSHVVLLDTDGFTNIIRSVPISGGETTVVVPDGEPFAFYLLTFSPDGSTIVSRSYGSPQVKSAPIDGSGVTLLTPALPATPAYSASNDHVIYAVPVDDPDNRDLYIVPIGGGTSTKLNPTIATPDGDVWDYGFTPDGSRVIFNAEIDTVDRRDLYTVPTSGGAVRIVPTDPASDVQSFSIAGNQTVLFETDGTIELQSAPTAGGAVTPISLASHLLVYMYSNVAAGSVTVYSTEVDGADREIAAYGIADTDSDGILNLCDNCFQHNNALQEDVDRDYSGDACDNCLDTINVDQADADSDEAGDVCDCAPHDPEYVSPAPIEQVWAAELVQGTIRLFWEPHAQADRYLVTRGTLGLLGPDEYGECLANDLSSAVYDDADPLAPGDGYLYLIQAESDICGAGSLGHGDDGERINTNPAACP